MHGRFWSYRRTLLAALLALGGGTVLSACADVNAPDRRERRGHIALAPSMGAASAAALGSSSTVIDNVRIIIRTADGTIVLDTVVTFPAGADEVALVADIPVHGDSERFRATIQLRSGDEVLFEGTQDLNVRPGEQSGTPASVPVTYVGTGSNAASVSLVPGDVEVSANGTSQFIATVRDGGGNIIQNVPLGWTSSNDEIATVSEDGVVTAKNVRGTAVITATTFGGVAGTASAHVVLPPSQLRVAGGGGQTGRVGETLPLPVVVELLAADGVGVANATVTFGATGTGASVTPSTATTDANGRASVVLTLGTTAGPYTFSASAASFSVSINATAIAGEPNRIAIASGNAQSAFTGTTLPLPLSVRVTDEFGNPGAGRQVTWTVVTAGSLALATSTTNATGIATNTYTLPNVAGENVVYATLSTGGGVAFTATALPRPAATIVATSGATQSGQVGSAAQPLVVRVTDALDQPVPGATVTWSVTGTATIGGPTSITNANGFASITANFGTTAGTSTVTASIAGATSAQFTLITTAGPPAILVIIAGDNQTGTSGNAVPIPPSVRLTDAFGNPIAGVQITFDSVSGGGFVTAGFQVTDANGVATVGAWTLGTFAGAQTLKARTGTLSVTFTATVPPTAFFIGQASGEGQIVAPSTTLQPLTVHATDFSESGVPGVTIQFTVISGTAVPMSGTAVTDANGHASFTPTSPGTPGSTVIKACLPGCSIFTTFSFTTVTGGSIWRGTADSDWFNTANWSTGAVPTNATDVLIPGDATNFVVLNGTPTMKTLFMASGSLMSLNGFDVDIAGNVNTTGAFVFGAGVFRIAGATTQITGSMPSLLITGTVTAANNTDVSGNVTVQTLGRLNIGAGAMTVSAGFNVDGGGRLTMTNAGGSLSINGDALFQGQDMGDTELTAGVLEIGGNLTAIGFNQAFRAAGTHKTRLTGFNTQTLFFSSAGAANSRFQNLEITNTSAGGIAMSGSNVYAAGTLLQGGVLTVGGTRILQIAGVLTLQNGSSTTVDPGGSLIHGGCVNQGGATNNFTC